MESTLTNQTGTINDVNSLTGNGGILLDSPVTDSRGNVKNITRMLAANTQDPSTPFSVGDRVTFTLTINSCGDLDSLNVQNL
jgi:hypothetical protein